MSSLKRKHIKPPKVCIFCRGNQVTGEHLWPNWSAPLFDSAPQGTTEIYQSGQTASAAQIRRRQGHVTRRPIFAVCGPCNNRWMSRLEEAAKSILIELSAANELELDANGQSILAHWVTIKMMVAEHTRRDPPVFNHADRHSFMTDAVIPDHLNIWVFRCGEGAWRSAWHRHARIVRLEPRSEPVRLGARDGEGPTAHSFAIGFNELFVYAHFVANPMLRLDFGAGAAGQRLWPPTGSALQWSPESGLAVREADEIAATLSQPITNASVVMQVPVSGRF